MWYDSCKPPPSIRDHYVSTFCLVAYGRYNCIYITFLDFAHSFKGICHTMSLTLFHVNVAPCKRIQDSLGFWIPCCGFRIPGTSIVDSGFQKELDSIFFRFYFFSSQFVSCSNLAILKDVVRRHNKFVFFFALQNYGKKCTVKPVLSGHPLLSGQ